MTNGKMSSLGMSLGRILWFVSLVSLTGAQSTPVATTTLAAAPSGTVIVDAGGNAQFTAINAAISYAQTYAQPTVLVRAGVYTEVVAVVGSNAVTIVGESPNASDNSQNKVTISNSVTPMSINSNSVKGISWRNINFVNTATGTAPAVSLRGTKNAFYNCQFISAGAGAITSTLGITLIANSYIEGSDKLFSGYLGLYVFGSTIAATASSSTIVYSRGYSVPIQFSQTVLDSCSIIQKPGTTNSYVYLAGANGEGSQAVFKYTSMASLIAPGGTRAIGVNGFFGEYATTGPGSYQYDTKRVDTLMTTAMLSNTTVDYVFANSFPGYLATTTDWIDADVLKAIVAANAVSSVPASSSASSSSSTTSSTTSSSTWSSSSSQSTDVSSSTTPTSTSSSSATSPASTCSVQTYPSFVPATALIVGPVGSCAGYNSLLAAIAALPAGSTAQYIYILAGTYTEQIPSFNRVGPTTFRGESASPLDQSSNLVTLQYSGSVPSSGGGSEEKAVFRSTQYNSKKYSFYNINFVNTATIATNTIAIAMDIKAQQVGFYSCGFFSGGGTFLANAGTFFLDNCRIEGSSDFFWGYGAAYVSNSVIVSNGPGYSIAAQSYTTAYASQFVFDHCAFIPKSITSMSKTTYLGRDYSASAHVAITNSFLDGHINPLGWLIKSAAATVSFAEFNNSGPGYVPTSRVSQVQLLTDASAYTVESVLGDVSWIDRDAIAPLKDFPPSAFVAVPSTTTASSTASATPTSGLPASSTYVVSLAPGTNEYGSVSAAVSALPNDGLEKVILIKAGTYTEQVNIQRSGKVTLRGTTSYVNDYSQNEVTLQFSYGVSTSAGQNELTPVLFTKKNDGSGIAIYNINFVNTFPQTNSYAALAADFYGANMAAYGCKFIGYQDTLLANKGTQLFSNCYIEGSVDFIWGFSTAYFHQCYLAANTPGTSIAAQSRASATTVGGYVFDKCYVTYTSTYGSSFGLTYLARPYSQYSVVVYKNSYLDKNINPAGWTVWQTSNPQTSGVTFGEYNNVGPSAWTSSTTRASFATNLTESQVAAYDLETFLGSTSWIDMEAYNFVPSVTFSSSGVNGTVPIPTPTPTPVANSTSSRPTSGTVPPVGAVLVSSEGSISGSFANLTAALASLPADSTPQTIFIYAGSYYEQFKINRPGPVTIVGYQSGNVGQTYQGNEVTITYKRGLSVVAPIPAGHSNAETAVVATASNKISFYNVNFINTDNLDGVIPSYVTLAGSIYGDQIGFYGCSMVGWQDTLLTGNPLGYAYYESSYIDGAIDFIWGYSLSYFKGCTIAAKKAKSCMTAQSRASDTATGGYIFDQCLFTAASTAAVDLTQSVYLGRPYSKFAKVVVKYSYLDSTIHPAGWKAWSTTDPRLDSITFAEYQNLGPGNWENNVADRLAFGNATLLTSDTYTLASVMPSTSWIDMTYWDSIVTPQTAIVPPITHSGNSTVPVDGACIVSKIVLAGEQTYPTIAECIAQLPASNALATIFIYAGVYDEQLTFNRTGPTVFRGYADTPDIYANNQVTIQNSNGVDTQGEQSNSDSATFYSRGKNVKFYNINLVNKFGTTADYASLAFSVGNNGNASFYGCQIIGNQDTLNINVGASIFVYNSMVAGTIDFIWGAGSAYFLASTISPRTNSISITADKRTTNTSIGGMVFDQCKVTPSAEGALVPGIAGSISLGRPWNANARVAYIRTYLDSSISAVGWVPWSKSTPNTDGVFFAEYQNTGPGAVRTGRATFSKEMSSQEALAFQIGTFFSSITWIDLTAVSILPFVASDIALTSTITSTIQPTGSVPLVTVSSTFFITATISQALSTFTKNVTEKVSSVVSQTELDEYQTTVLKFTTTEVSTISPSPKLITTTINQIVYSTLTISGASALVTEIKTSKVTGVISVTPSPVTDFQTISVKETTTQVVTPKPVSQIVTLLSTESSILTSTPKGKTQSIVSTIVLSSQTTAPTPVVVLTVTNSGVINDIKTTSLKPVTKTTIFYTTIPAGPTVTVKAKKSVTSFVSFTSTVISTKKATTTLTCLPPNKAKRSFRNLKPVEYLEKRQAASSTIPVVTVYTTLPQSTSTILSLTTLPTTTTVFGSKLTITQVITSFILKTTIIPGAIFTSTISSVKTVAKATTLPVVTSTIVVNLQGTSISTLSLKGVTSTEVSTLFTTVKTETKTLPGITFSSLITRTILATKTSTLPAETFLSTVTSVKTVRSTLVLPVSTLTLTNFETVKQVSTIVPPATTKTSTVLKLTTIKSTVTLPQSTVLISKTSTSAIPTPTVTVTGTVVKSTTLKQTSVTTVFSTKTAKNLPTCA